MGSDKFRLLTGLIEKHWGFTTLRPQQEQAMRCVLGRRDSLVVLPTGGGKSLCFQAPALLSESEPTVVVSPLIALMKDQVDSLRAVGVSARHIDSTLSDEDRVTVFNELKANKVRLLFVSPERLAVPQFQTFLKTLGVRTFAIDEAHCISHWGHDFRPEYRQLRNLREGFPDAVFHGYTATATERVREDIIAQLSLQDPEVLVGNFDRPNLFYRVLPRRKLLDQVIEVLKRHENEAGIIYCIRRKDVDELAADLRDKGYNALPYHAGMSGEDRRSAQDAFRSEKCDLIVATVAFGMGIDRSNVRFVLHTGMPKSIEHYQQEAGRAGRDGLEAECILLTSGADVLTWKRILEKSAAENAVDPEFLPGALAHLDEIASFCRGAVCRHKVLVEHFGQKFEQPNCAACDLCLGEVEIEPDSQDLARKILSCVARVGERFGVGYVIEVLRGSSEEKIVRNRHDQLSTHGLMKEHPAPRVRDWVYQLIGLGVLEQTEDEYPILKLNPRSWQVLRNEETVSLRRAEDKPKKKTAADTESWEGVDRDLFEHLRVWRRETADANNWPPYVVFSDNTLRDLARVRPSNLASLRAVYGIGDAKSQAFGESVLAAITSWCGEHGLSMDNVTQVPERETSSSSASRSASNAEPYFRHFREKRSIAEIAQLMGRSPSTIVKYLDLFLESEPSASLETWVPLEVQKRVLAAAGDNPNPFLKPLFESLNGEVGYDAIRLTLSSNRRASGG